jgi:phage tail tube protein FII
MKRNLFLMFPVVIGMMLCASDIDAKKPKEKAKSKQMEITITGQVIINDEGSTGKATSVSIEVHEAEDLYEYYDVVMDETGKELLDQVDNRVTVTGYVKVDIVKKKLLTVKSWGLIREKDEEPYEPEKLEPETEEESSEGVNDDIIEL